MENLRRMALFAQVVQHGSMSAAARALGMSTSAISQQVRALQAALNARGFDTGTPDGVAGPATRAGLRRYQQSVGMVADGYPTIELLERITAQP